MKDKIAKKDKFLILVSVILFISFILNCYQVIINKRYKSIIELTCYKNIEEIRIKNENILSILDSCIKAENISNEELLTLYKNYLTISNKETELLEYYLEYKDNPTIKTTNNNATIESGDTSKFYWEIEELVYSYIQRDLSEKAESMKIVDEKLEDFNILKNISEELNNYYINFYNEKCTDLDETSRAEEIIKNAYWIEILQEIQNINQDYIDYEFTYENLDNGE